MRSVQRPCVEFAAALTEKLPCNTQKFTPRAVIEQVQDPHQLRAVGVTILPSAAGELLEESIIQGVERCGRTSRAHRRAPDRTW